MNDNLPGTWLGRIIKNAALGSALLGQVAYSYYEKKNQTEGMDLLRSILVLPMLFHSSTVAAIHKMGLKSGLVKAVLENKIILNGLEERVTDTLPTTFRAIQMGEDSGLYRVDKFERDIQLIPTLSSFPIPVSTYDEKIRHMFHAARRIGHWFDHDSLSLYKMLQVRL
jgi:hypothetical protein